MANEIPDGMSLVSDDQFSEVRTRFAETASGVGVYGAYAILLVITTYTLIKQGLRNSRARQILFAIVWFMFINSTIVGMVYVSFFVMSIDGLQTTRPNPPTFEDFDRLYVVLIVFTDINFILSDGIVVWRAWVLYPGNSKVKGFLTLCMTGSLVATIFNTILSIREVPHTHEEREGPGTLWFFLPLLATNLVATFLVGYKVWSYRSVWSELSNVKAVSSKSPVEVIMVIIVESGVLFCFYWIITMLSALRVVGTLGHELLECILPQIEGIYLTLVILLVASQRETCGIAPATIGFAEFSAIDFATREQTNFSQTANQRHTTTPRISGSFVERVKEKPQWSQTRSSRSSDIETGSSQVN
ncbi:hypothetical protein VKT23_006510 [Stygiomarasmius scandens]|uniref:Uncharacterized protein n=1 Tax=Marasmiellus scandens TaxID=2682957 RepID=A0ABR1JNW3_9AGAR